MRHVSRTHRAALDWLFDRINLGSRNPKSSTSTPNNQLADILTKGNFHTWWVESFVVLVQYQPFQFYSLLWNNGETISTRFRRRTSHSKIADQWWALLPGRRRTYHHRLQKARGTEVVEIKIPGVQLLRKRSDQGDLISALTEWKHPTTIIMSNSWKASLQQATQSGMTTVFGLQKSGKLILEMYERSGRPDETSWRATREIRPGFSHEGKYFMMEPRNPLRMRKYLVTDRSDPISILKKGHGLNNSSLETMNQKWNCQ